jgi:hypothetical protein
MGLNIDADVGGDAEADSNGAFLNLFGKLTASIDSLSATISKQMQREQWLLSHVPVSIPVTGSTLNGDVTRIVDFGGPQPGREWVIRLLTATTDAMATNAAQVTWYVGNNIPTGAGTLLADWAIWQFTTVPGFQNFTSDVHHIKSGEHLLAGVTGIVGGTPIRLKASIHDEILYDYDRR